MNGGAAIGCLCVLLLTLPSCSSGQAAAVSGKVVYNEARCPQLDINGDIFPLIPPALAESGEPADRYQLSDGTVIEDGAQIATGGGTVPLDPGTYRRVIERCGYTPGAQAVFPNR